MILAILAAVVALGCLLERQRRGGQYAVIAMVATCLALNIAGVLPKSAPVYGFINQYLIPLAIPLLMFDANLARIWRESGRMLLAFVAAVVATLLGCWIALQLSQMHAEESVWAAIVTAGFIGSAANTMAVAMALERSADAFFPLLLASVYVVTVPVVVLLLSLPAIPKLWAWYSPRSLAPQEPLDRKPLAHGIGTTETGDARDTLPNFARSLILGILLAALILWFSA